MIGWGPKCYIQRFVKIGLPVLEKKIFEWFLPYMSVTRISRSNIRSPDPWMLHIKFHFNWPSGFGEEAEIVDDGRRTDGRTDAGLIGIL